MVLYETTPMDYKTDFSFADKVMIGIGGTCTVRLENGEVIDLIETCVNYNIRTLTGRSYEDSLYMEHPFDWTKHTFSLDEITEVIFEGFYIKPENRETILKLIHEDGITFTKIPRRD